MAVSKEGVSTRVDKTKIRKRVVHLTGSVLAGAALAFGADQKHQSVSAATNTPTPSTTSTPDTMAIRVAGTRTALAVEFDRLQKERELANLDKTATTIAQQREALRTPATATSTPTKRPTQAPTRLPAEASATADAIRLAALGKRQAEIKATATYEAELTSTPATKLTATTEVKQATAAQAVSREVERNRNQGGGPPGILNFILGGVVTGSGVLGLMKRDWIRTHTPNPIRTRAARVRDWVRGRFGG